MGIRINKFIAQNTQYSRRKADELISNGLVTINCKYADPGDMIDDTIDVVRIEGKVLKNNAQEEFVYFLLNKPINVLSTVADARGRTTVVNFIDTNARVFPVGRLDYQSSGLILLTNDGDLAFKMTHPKFHIPKKYIVHVEENINESQLDAIRQGGISIENKNTKKADIRKISARQFDITLYQGIKRQIRLSCAHVGLTVKSLKRYAIGELLLGDLEEGESRQLNKEELEFILSIKRLKK